MPLLRHFRPLLERLLEVSVKSEATARERALEREIKQLKKTLGEQESDARAACDQLGVVIQDHKATIDNLNVIAATREDRIDSLEHEIEILKQDLRGMGLILGIRTIQRRLLTCIATTAVLSLTSTPTSRG